jgi:hypothetical protein
MKQKVILTSFLVACCLPFVLLVSCAGIQKSPQFISPSLEEKSLTTLGILPVTYDARYEEPLDVRLTQTLLRNAENLLKAKGYRTVILSELPGAAAERYPDVLKMEPSQITRNVPEDVDGVVGIHIRSHFGIDITERQPQGLGPSISLNATARLVSVENHEDLWRDNGIGRSITESRFMKRTQFWVRLNQATRSLVDSLFATLPAKTK